MPDAPTFRWFLSGKLLWQSRTMQEKYCMLSLALQRKLDEWFEVGGLPMTCECKAYPTIEALLRSAGSRPRATGLRPCIDYNIGDAVCLSC